MSHASRADVVCAPLAVDGIDANQATDNGSTALIRASQGGDAEIGPCWPWTGSTPNHADENGDAALTYAAQTGHAKVTRTLLTVDGIDANQTNDDDSSDLVPAVVQSHTKHAPRPGRDGGLRRQLEVAQAWQRHSAALHFACHDLHGAGQDGDGRAAADC